MGLLTRREEAIDQVTRTFRFDVRLLARRLLDVVCWLDGQAETRSLPKSFFGASTGAAAALVAAAARPHAVTCIVSRGGRPDLAGEFLSKVRAPTLLIVGGNDYDCLALNQSALRKLKSVPSRLQVVPGASHLFEEPGALQQVASAATDWYARWMRPREGPRSSVAADPIRGEK
jgi:pimeloyl-ACP methyl ester carboxylesterase